MSRLTTHCPVLAAPRPTAAPFTFPSHSPRGSVRPPGFLLGTTEYEAAGASGLIAVVSTGTGVRTHLARGEEGEVTYRCYSVTPSGFHSSRGDEAARDCEILLACLLACFVRTQLVHRKDLGDLRDSSEPEVVWKNVCLNSATRLHCVVWL